MHICDHPTAPNPTDCASCIAIIAAVEAKWSKSHG